jgi:hypothetical protein
MKRMKAFNISRLTFLTFGIFLATVPGARAIDLNGMWAADGAECNDVFVKKGKTISFSKHSDLHARGFIVEGDRLRGKLATCKIKSRREDGDTVNIIAACATDIMLSDVQLILKVVDQNKIMRVFPGIPDMQQPYERCTMK